MEVKWIKLSTDIFSNRKIRQIERMSDGDAIIVIWLKLLILAGELNDGGQVYFTKSVPFTEESLAIQFDRPREVIALALKTFQSFDMIEIGKGGIITILNWERYQNIEGMERIREQNRLRKQKQRSKEEGVTEMSHVTSRDSHGTDKNRLDKNRLEKNKSEETLRNDFRKLAKSLEAQWQHNVDADETNKEIRT